MTKLITVGVAFATILTTASLSPALGAPSPEGVDNQETVAFCKFHITERPTANLGECMSHVETLFNSPNGYPPHLCDALIETDPTTFFDLFDSYSDCIRDSRGS